MNINVNLDPLDPVHHFLKHCQQTRVPQHGLSAHRQTHYFSPSHLSIEVRYDQTSES